MDIAVLEGLARQTPGVSEVHDLHVWSLAGDAPVVTAHVVLAAGAHGVEVARDVLPEDRERVGHCHLTVQPEASPPRVQPVPASGLSRPRS